MNEKFADGFYLGLFIAMLVFVWFSIIFALGGFK